jgi:hypothetical protein
LKSDNRCFSFMLEPLLDNSLDEPCPDRELRSGQTKCFAGKLDRNPVELEHDAAWRDPADPEFRRALAFAHANFGWLLRDGDIRKDANPDAACAAHMAGQSSARGLDLARSNPFGLYGLEAELAEIQFEPGFRSTVYPALEGFAEFCSLGLQHDRNS